MVKARENSSAAPGRTRGRGMGGISGMRGNPVEKGRSLHPNAFPLKRLGRPADTRSYLGPWVRCQGSGTFDHEHARTRRHAGAG